MKIAQQEFDSLALNNDAALKVLSDEQLKQHANEMEHVHEYIKTRTNLLGESGQAAKYEEAALNALNNDQKRNFKVEVAANTLRRLVKAGASGDQYKAKARELFKYAKYFE